MVSANTWSIGASGGINSIAVGAGGIDHASSMFVNVNAPIALTISQTWTTAKAVNNNGAAAVTITGAISGSNVNLTFDGKGVHSAARTLNGDQRYIYSLRGLNTYTGTTTITGGAHLRLDYTPANTSRLADTTTLVLAGGTVSLNGGANVVEDVGATTVAVGYSTIVAGPNGGGGAANRLQMGALTHQVGGTFDVTTAVNSLASTSTGNIGGIIGGWATMGGGTAWAVSGATITNSSGTDRIASSAWGATENVNVTVAESGIGDKKINALRIKDANEGLSFASASTLTLTSGGIIAANTGQYINGGKITTEAVTSGVGEVFVHNPNAFTIGAAVVNNTSTPTALVKDGLGILTMTGVNTHTGGTYINSGTLTLDNGGTLADSDVTIAGGATLSAGTTGQRGTLTFNVADNTADLIAVAEGGVFDIQNFAVNVVFSGTQTLSEYVLANRNIDTTSILGDSFFSKSLPAGWDIDYDGTTLHPDSIVFVAVPEPAVLGIAGIGLAGLIRRRRLHTSEITEHETSGIHNQIDDQR